MPAVPAPLASRITRLACLACALLLAACSPKYNWREVHGTAAPFFVLLPAKPASHTRPVDLNGTPITMTMTAAEIDDVTFAVGTAQLPQGASGPKAISAMKLALVSNIHGTVQHEQASPPGETPSSIEVEAIGPAGSRGERVMLLGRFIAREPYIYQVIVVGNEKSLSREAADTFFSSFELR